MQPDSPPDNGHSPGFKIPGKALAPQGEAGLVQFEGQCATYTKEERAFMRTLPRNEMSFIHDLKATFDAELVSLPGGDG
jgi:hypothetical protein